MRILVISGSLRAVSSNTSLLKAAQMLAPNGVRIDLYEGLGQLPHFNPDLDCAPFHAAVADLHTRIGAADGLLISSPEYARGVPGALKNALDWLVSGSEFPGKPVAFFNASDRGTHAQAALRLTLETMSARMVDAAMVTVHLLGKTQTPEEIANDPDVAPRLKAGLDAFVKAVAGCAGG